jgi:hypothetical protein
MEKIIIGGASGGIYPSFSPHVKSLIMRLDNITSFIDQLFMMKEWIRSFTDSFKQIIFNKTVMNVLLQRRATRDLPRLISSSSILVAYFFFYKIDDNN